jgi:hypothetical protein
VTLSSNRRLWQQVAQRRNGEVCFGWWCCCCFVFVAFDVEIPARAIVTELANGEYSFVHSGVTGTFTRAEVEEWADEFAGEFTASLLVPFAELVAAQQQAQAERENAKTAQEQAQVAQQQLRAERENAKTAQAQLVAAEQEAGTARENAKTARAQRVAAEQEAKAEREYAKTAQATAFNLRLNAAANAALNACMSFFKSKFPVEFFELANVDFLIDRDEQRVAALISNTSCNSVAELCGAGYVEHGDQGDKELLEIMEQWWADVCNGDVASTKEFPVTPALVAKVLGSGEGDEVSEVQPVMCSLLATYFAVAWADTPWLRFFAERRTIDAPDGTVTSTSNKSRYYDAAAVASSTKITTIDDVARASAVMSFEFKPWPARGGSAATALRVLVETCGQSLEDAASVLMPATPGASTPCLFAFAGTSVDFDLLRMHHDFSSNTLAVHRFKVTPTSPRADQLRRGVGKWIDAFAGSSRELAISLLKPIHQVIQHVVHHHSLAALPAVEAAKPWRMPTPLMIASSFALPPPLLAAATVLEDTYAPFEGATALSFAGDCTIKFEAVLGATERRMVCRVQLGATERRLVLKFASSIASIVCERDRVKRVCQLFASGALHSHRDRVRLPLGCIDGRWPVLVSDVWPGRSLNVGCPSDNATRKKVRELLERQIWPVVDALAANGVFYVDLHAGNVMVDEVLENAWLIDFEGAVEVAEIAGSPTEVVEKTKPTTAQLSAAVAAQKADLLKQFEDK